MMRLFGRVLVGVALLIVAPDRIWAQAAPVAQSATLAKELADLMAQRKMDSIAAKHPAADDQFVAALAFPGQLLVVWARYTAPAVLKEKIARGEHRDVYIDLNSASIPESKVLITDLGAPGLRSRREENEPFDTQDSNGRGIRFDGNWREGKMSEQEYMKAFAEADQAYSTALQALIAALKSTSR